MCVSERRPRVSERVARATNVHRVLRCVSPTLRPGQPVVPLLGAAGANTRPANLTPHRQRLIRPCAATPLLLRLTTRLRDRPREPLHGLAPTSQACPASQRTQSCSCRPDPCGGGVNFTPPVVRTRGGSSARNCDNRDRTDPISIRVPRSRITANTSDAAHAAPRAAPAPPWPRQPRLCVPPRSPTSLTHATSPDRHADTATAPQAGPTAKADRPSCCVVSGVFVRGGDRIVRLPMQDFLMG